MLNRYLKDIRGFSQLDRFILLKLIKKARKGSKAARNKIINSYLKFVVFISRRYKCTHLSKEDLISEGNFGLFRAIEKYKIKSKCKFSTYAGYWIRQKIGRAIREKEKEIKIPIYIEAKLPHYIKISHLSRGEIKKKLKIKERVLRLLELANIQKLSLDYRKQGEEKENSKLSDFITDHKDIKESLDKKEIKEMIDILPPRTAIIIKERFYNRKTLQELSDDFGVSKQRIQQIEKEGIEQLSKSPIAKELNGMYRKRRVR